MEPALSHWLPLELCTLQLAPNTLVYEEKVPGTMQYLLHLLSFGRPRQEGVPGQGCACIPFNTHSTIPAMLARTHHTHTRSSGPMLEPSATQIKAHVPGSTHTPKNRHGYTLNTQEKDAGGMLHICT